MNNIHSNTVDIQDVTYNSIIDLLVIQISFLIVCLEEASETH